MEQYRKGRRNQEIRPIAIEIGLQKYAAASVFWSQGDTRVLTAVTVEEGVPAFLRDSGQGWLTAEYALLPASTLTRSEREAAKGKQSGRTVEIQRLIGRSLRQAVDLELLGEHTIKIDCEVIQADGGTRTAAISSAWLALALAARKLHWEPGIIKNRIAAISVGIVGGEIALDLEYSEDSQADVDMNVVMTGAGHYVEIQGTGEHSDFSPSQLTALLAMAEKGVHDIFAIEDDFLNHIPE